MVVRSTELGSKVMSWALVNKRSRSAIWKDCILAEKEINGEYASQTKDLDQVIRIQTTLEKSDSQGM